MGEQQEVQMFHLLINPHSKIILKLMRFPPTAQQTAAFRMIANVFIPSLLPM